jgi:hypothetical protein
LATKRIRHRERHGDLSQLSRLESLSDLHSSFFSFYPLYTRARLQRVRIFVETTYATGEIKQALQIYQPKA